MGAVTPGETLGTLYNIHVGSNKTKQHSRGAAPRARRTSPEGRYGPGGATRAGPRRYARQRPFLPMWGVFDLSRLARTGLFSPPRSFPRRWVSGGRSGRRGDAS